MLAARNDFAILFNGDALARQIERLDQLGQGKRCREGTGFAVDDQFNHSFYPGMSFRMTLDSTLKGTSALDGNHDRKTFHCGAESIGRGCRNRTTGALQRRNGRGEAVGSDR